MALYLQHNTTLPHWADALDSCGHSFTILKDRQASPAAAVEAGVAAVAGAVDRTEADAAAGTACHRLLVGAVVELEQHNMLPIA